MAAAAGMLAIPQDVRDWVRYVFEACSNRTARKISRIPTVHETSLDLTFIEHFSQFGTPVRLPSEWLIRIDTHYLGGGRHIFGQWEVADIGLLVIFRRAGRLIRSKIALLQAKRLYPIEQSFSEDQPRDYQVGFARLFESDESFARVTKPRRFTFTAASAYKALQVSEAQYKAISAYENKFSIPVHYLFYNPLRIPSSVVVPISGPAELPASDVGCRIVPAATLRKVLRRKKKGYSPTYGDLANFLPAPFTTAPNTGGWRFEDFVADLLIECREGYVAENQNDPGLFRVFNLRQGPIAAAVSITFDAPGG